MAHRSLPAGLSFAEFVNASGGLDQFNSREQARAAYEVYKAEQVAVDAGSISEIVDAAKQLETAIGERPAVVPESTGPGRFAGPRRDPAQVGFVDFQFNPNELTNEFRTTFPDLELPRIVF